MKLAFLLLAGMLTINTGWLTNFNDAQKIAREKHEYILLNFSGSDWCGPCMRLRNEIFGSAEFKQYAETNLVLLNADFPRSKKNKLSAEQVKLNEALADKYNPKGKFPYTLLINADGKVIREWDGYPDVKPGEFVQQIMANSANNK